MNGEAVLEVRELVVTQPESVDLMPRRFDIVSGKIQNCFGLDM
jgi:hypothetical protein